MNYEGMTQEEREKEALHSEICKLEIYLADDDLPSDERITAKEKIQNLRFELILKKEAERGKLRKEMEEWHGIYCLNSEDKIPLSFPDFS